MVEADDRHSRGFIRHQLVLMNSESNDRPALSALRRGRAWRRLRVVEHLNPADDVIARDRRVAGVDERGNL